MFSWMSCSRSGYTNGHRICIPSQPQQRALFIPLYWWKVCHFHWRWISALFRSEFVTGLFSNLTSYFQIYMRICSICRRSRFWLLQKPRRQRPYIGRHNLWGAMSYFNHKQASVIYLGASQHQLIGLKLLSGREQDNDPYTYGVLLRWIKILDHQQRLLHHFRKENRTQPS